MNHPTDRELVERAQSGDPSATACLFSRFWRAARAAALGVTGDWAAAARFLDIPAGTSAAGCTTAAPSFGAQSKTYSTIGAT